MTAGLCVVSGLRLKLMGQCWVLLVGSVCFWGGVGSLKEVVFYVVGSLLSSGDYEFDAFLVPNGCQFGVAEEQGSDGCAVDDEGVVGCWGEFGDEEWGETGHENDRVKE